MTDAERHARGGERFRDFFSAGSAISASTAIHPHRLQPSVRERFVVIVPANILV